MADDPLIEMQDDEGNPIDPPPPELITGALNELVQGAGNPVTAMAGEDITAANPIDGRDAVQDAFYAGEYTPQRWDGVMEDGAPGVYEDPAVPPTTVAPTIPGAPPSAPLSVSAGASRSQSQGASKSTSYAGVPQAKQDSFYQDYLNQTQAEGNAIARQAQGQVEQATAGFDNQRAAVLGMVAEEQAHADNLLGIYRDAQATTKAFAEMEMQVYEQGKVVRSQIMADYTDQIVAIRAMNATTGNPFGAMGGGQGAAMGGAMFAQGFLAAQGININVAGQIDKWVDRSINEHQTRIGNAQTSANNQLHLYDMARQSSQDEWEARERYRGFVMEGFKQAIQVEAMRFGSATAMGKAQQKIAEIDALQAKTVRGIADAAEKKYVEAEKRQLDLLKVRNQAAHEKRSDAASWRSADASMLQAKTGAKAEDRAGKESKDKRPFQIGDIEYTTQPALGPDGKPQIGPDGKPRMIEVPKVIWNIREDAVAKKGAMESRNNWANYEDRWNNVIRLRDLAYKDLEKNGLLGTLGEGNTLGIGARQSPAFRAYTAAKLEFARAQLKQTSGAAVTNEEVAEKLKQLPDEQIFAAGENGQVWIEMREIKRKEFEREMETYSDSVIRQGASPGAATDHKNSLSPLGATESAVVATAGYAKEASDKNVDSTPNRAWKGFIRQQGELNPNRTITTQVTPEWSTYYDRIAQIAADPETAKRVNEDSTEALTALEAIGRDETLPEDRRAYAQHLAGRVLDDPGSLVLDLTDEQDPDALKFK